MRASVLYGPKHSADSMVSQEHLHQRKRRRDEPLPADENQQPKPKRRKSKGSKYSPQFWDSLSKIPLTRRALEEFDRRTGVRHSQQAVRAKEISASRRVLRPSPRRLRDYASSGGPDLSKLRGYADKPTLHAAMSQSSSQRSKRTRSPSRSKSRASNTTKTTTYSAEFVQKAIDRGVYPDGYEDSDGEVHEPENLDTMRQMLAQSRASLSPSKFSEARFKQFKRDNRNAASEGDAMAEAIPTITGVKDKQFYSARTMPFYRLAKLDPELSAPNPDKYYGARPKQINERVRNDLDQYIIPSNATSRPAAPNFFLEGKSASGKPDVAQRQAMYDGWAGARGMLQLQNYGNPTPVFDGNAYTMAATYHPGTGTLQMYATHPRESASGKTEYYMTQLDGHYMIGTSEAFRKGAAAFRNAREWTQQQRDRFIGDANAKVESLAPAATPSSRTTSEDNVSSRIASGSFESDTSTDELAPEKSTKRQRE